MSGKKPAESKPWRAYGLTRSQWREVRAILRMQHGIPKEVLEQQSAALRGFGQLELLTSELESALQFSASMTRQIAGDLAQVSEYLQWMTGLRLILRHIDGVDFIARTLSEYYRGLVDLRREIQAVPEIAIRPNVEVAIPLSLLQSAGDQATFDFALLVQNAGRFAADIMFDMVADIDYVALATHWAASSSWRSYELDTTRLIPASDEVDLPGSVIDHYPQLITEAFDPDAADDEGRTSELAKEIRALMAEATSKLDEFERCSSHPSVRVSGVVVDSNALGDTQLCDVSIEDGSVVVRTQLPVVVARPSTRQVVRIEDIEADSELFVLDAKGDSTARKKIISRPRLYHSPDTITLTWWVDEQKSLCMNALVGAAIQGELRRYRTRGGKLPNEAVLLLMLLHNNKRGLTFREAVEGIYPDDLRLLGRDQLTERKLIMRMRSSLQQIRIRFEQAGINSGVVPKSWGVNTLTQPIMMKAANIVDILGRNAERTDYKFAPLFDETHEYINADDDDDDDDDGNDSGNDSE